MNYPIYCNVLFKLKYMAKTKEFHLYKAVFLIAFISLLQNKQLLAHDVDQRLDTVDIQNLQENQRLVVGQNFGPMFDNIDGQVIYSQVREVEIDRTDIFYQCTKMDSRKYTRKQYHIWRHKRPSSDDYGNRKAKKYQ